MSVISVKVNSAAVLFTVAAAGSLGALRIETLRSMVAVHIAYAFSAGILLAVAMVHMLPDNSAKLEDAGRAMSSILGGQPDDAFPLGNALFVLGFLLITAVEATLRNIFQEPVQCASTLASVVVEKDNSLTKPMLCDDALLTDVEAGQHNHRAVADAGKANTGGWCTLIGLTIHSVVEGMATGAGADATSVTFLVFAIACHKGFAAFALAAANLPLRAQGRGLMWWSVTMWFSISGPFGMLIGALISASADGPTTAAISCVAAGTLLSVGINEMLSPALHDNKAIGIKLLVFLFSTLAMTLLAVWA